MCRDGLGDARPYRWMALKAALSMPSSCRSRLAGTRCISTAEAACIAARSVLRAERIERRTDIFTT